MTPVQGGVATLVLRLEGPLQSWGLNGRSQYRTTAPQPTKSGVVGMLAAALGRERGHDPSDLAGLHMGVVTVRPGDLHVDYHTARYVKNPSGDDLKAIRGYADTIDHSKVETQQTMREYLTDAAFVVTLTGPTELVTELAAAVQRPRWALTLGRRACQPSRPVYERVAPGGPEEVWAGFPGCIVTQDADPATPGAQFTPDTPSSTDPARRMFQLRATATHTVPVPADAA